MKSNSANRPKREMPTIGWRRSDTVVLRESQRHSNNAPHNSTRHSSTVNAGTKNRSNCSRDRWAGNISASFDSNKADSERLRASSSSSSFSSRSRSSSRIWNQLTAATSVPRPMKTRLTWPASELA
jgi:hypothetical protein